MVLIDSSVWLASLDPAHPSAYKARIQLEELLGNYMVSTCDSVRFDVLQSIHADQRGEFLSYFNQLPLLGVKVSTWNIAIQIAWEMQAVDQRLSQGEAVVVALSLQNQIPLFTYSHTQKSVQQIRRLKLIV